MSIYIASCPRCGAGQISFDVRAINYVGLRDGWQDTFEVFCVCRNCKRSTVFVLGQKKVGREIGFDTKDVINAAVDHHGYILIKDIGAVSPPDFIDDENLTRAFNEGASSVAIRNWNSAGAMFRACIDLATRSLLPEEGTVGGPNSKQRRDLGLRLPWLFDNGRLPADLRELSTCIHQDGNDAAHAVTLTEHDARDILDFTTALLERLYTEPERLRSAKQRRDMRRAPKADGDA